MKSFSPHILLLGPARTAVSGVSTHLNQLFGSNLATSFHLSQFQVGSEGRAEGRLSLLWRTITSPLKFTARLVRDRTCIVHINTSLEPKSFWRDLGYLAVAKLLRHKVVYQVHGGALPQDFFANSRLLTSVLRQVLSWPNVVVVLSSREMAAYRQFAPDVRLELIANAIEVHDADVSAARHWTPAPLEVAYVGRLADSKGVFEIIEAARILRDRGIAMRFSFAGTGPAEARLRAAIDAADLAGRVALLGSVFGEAKQQLWQRVNVFAFPTYHREGLPYSLLESMAAGAVPIASPVGGIPDVMQHEVQGLFVASQNPTALADALERVAKDRGLLMRLAIAARKRIEAAYSVTRLALEFQQLYVSLS